MNQTGKVKWSFAACCLAAVTSLTLGVAQGKIHNAHKERVIKVVAQRFFYTPNEIKVKTGEAVRIEFTALDFIHGFKIPDLNIRADLPPGRVTVVHLKPLKAGSYDFLCDNFCGSGHEDMNGKIVVSD